MSVTRASTRAVRSGLRAPVARSHLHTSRARAIDPKDNLGGPYGQEKPPANPGGPEAAKRNWVPIAAGVAAVGAGFMYFARSSPKEEKFITKAKQLETQGAAKAEDLKNQGLAKAQELENKAKNLTGVGSPKAMQEMSGRKGDTGFRSE